MGYFVAETSPIPNYDNVLIQSLMVNFVSSYHKLVKFVKIGHDHPVEVFMLVLIIYHELKIHTMKNSVY